MRAPTLPSPHASPTPDTPSATPSPNASPEEDTEADPDTQDPAALESVRILLDPTLRGIEATVRAADVDGYLGWLDPTEAHFAREQRNWAIDLTRHRPDRFELRITALAKPNLAKPNLAKPNQEPPEPAPATIRCELEMSWSFPSPSSPPGPGPASAPAATGWSRTVRFPAVFTLNESVDPPRWRFAGEDWLFVRSDDGRNTVCYAAGFEENALRVLATLPKARARVDRLFGLSLEHEQVVKLYPDARWLLASIYLSYKDPIGGWNEPGESIKLVSRRLMSEKATLFLLSHEYGHVATFVFDEQASEMAWWAVEGVAEVAAYIAGREELEDATAFDANTSFISPNAWKRVLDWHRTRKLAAWDDITDFRNTNASLGGHVYKQGEHMVGFVGERFGRQRMIAWISQLAKQRPIDEVCLESLGIPFAELDRLWQEAIAARASDAQANQPEDKPQPQPQPQPETKPKA